MYRIGDWLTETPTVKSLTLNGFFSKKDEKDLEQLSSSVFVTPDGAYAICVGSAEWLKRVSGRAAGKAKSNDIISVVDLPKLSIMSTTARTKDLELFEYHDVQLDDENSLRIDSLSAGKEKHSTFVRLSIPSLTPGPKFEYYWVSDFPAMHPLPVTTEMCEKALNSRSLEDYLQGHKASSVTPDPCEKNSAEFCRLPGREYTSDGKFGVAFRPAGHDNLFGSWVTTGEDLVIFSSAKRTDVTRINEPTNDSFRTSLTSLRGRNYLLVLQGGTHFMVCELRD